MGKERYSPTKDIKKRYYKKTEQQVKGEYRYPYIKVMTVYALIGGAIGGIAPYVRIVVTP